MKPSQFLQSLKTLTKEELLAINGIGEVLANNVIEFAQSERNDKLISKFEKLEENGKAPEIKISKVSPNNGLTVCITGTFDIARDKIAEILINKGYKVVTSITKKTNILLAGNDAGSKLEKAQKAGVKVVNDYNLL